MTRRLLLAGSALASFALAALVWLAVRHHPIAHQRFITIVLSGSFVVASIAIGSAVLALRLEPWWGIAALDLAAWIPMLGVVEVARGGHGSPLTWVGASICARTAVLVIVLGCAIAQKRVGDQRAALALSLIAVLFYVAPLPLVRLDRGLQLKGDEPHYMVTTISLLRDHDLFVEDEYADHVYTPFYNQTLMPPHAVPARDGHLAPFHDAGLPIISTIPYAIGGWVAVVLAMAMLACLTVREMFLLARRAGADALAAFAASAAIGFTLPLALYATQIYPEIPGALLTVFVARRLMSGTGRIAWLAAGFGLGALPWFQVRFWTIVVPLLVAALLIRRDSWHRLAVVGPLVLMTLAYVGLNFAVYGRLTLSPFLFHESIGPQLGNVIAASGGPLAVGLDAVRPWLDPYDGPFWLSPVLLLAVIAIPLMLRRATLISWASMGAIALYSLFVGAHYLISTSGDSPPGRFMVAVIPLLVLPLSYALRRPLRSWTLPLVSLLAAAGAVMVVVCIEQPLLARYPFAGMGGPVNIVLHSLRLSPKLLPSFPQPTAAALLKSLVAVAVIMVLAFLMARADRAQATGPEPNRPYNGSSADLPGRRDRAAPPRLR